MARRNEEILVRHKAGRSCQIRLLELAAIPVALAVLVKRVTR
jgi:hypothetical protein